MYLKFTYITLTQDSKWSPPPKYPHCLSDYQKLWRQMAEPSLLST